MLDAHWLNGSMVIPNRDDKILIKEFFFVFAFHCFDSGMILVEEFYNLNLHRSDLRSQIAGLLLAPFRSGSLIATVALPSNPPYRRIQNPFFPAHHHRTIADRLHKYVLQYS